MDGLPYAQLVLRQTAEAQLVQEVQEELAENNVKNDINFIYKWI